VIISFNNFAYVPGKNWVSLAQTLSNGDTVDIRYNYCLNGDIVITNWDGDEGNYIFYNTNTPTGIGSNANHSSLSSVIDLYPNPAKDHIIVKLKTEASEKVDIVLTDLLGCKIRSWYFLDLPGDVWHTLDIQTVPAGSYIVTVHAGSLMLSKRLIVLDK